MEKEHTRAGDAIGVRRRTMPMVEITEPYSFVGANGDEATPTPYSLLDLTATARQEEWEEPKGRADSLRPARADFAQ